MVIVWVVASQSTTIPRDSEIKRRGRYVLPFIISGATSRVTLEASSRASSLSYPEYY